MYKKLKGIMAFALAMTIVPFSAVTLMADEQQESTATGTEVATAAEFLAALENEDAVIELTADIVVDQKVNIMHDVTINGNGNTISGNDQAGWQGLYILHFYNVTGTLKDITLTNGDAGLLVNGSNVTLEGTINVSGNEFGGIEVSKGVGVVNEPVLNVKGATLVNDTESETNPTIWLDKLTSGVVFNDGQLDSVAKDDQVYFFIAEEEEVEETVSVASEAELLAALASGETHIVLSEDITVTAKINIMHDVVIDGAGHTLKAEGTEGWEGLYLLHFYQVEATVKDVVLTGGDAGMLVNGSKVTLEGTVDVSGNEFGGIEVSQGSGVANKGELDVSNATLVNTTEDFAQPTIWVVNGQGSVVGAGSLFPAYVAEKNQIFYHVNAVTKQEAQATSVLLNYFATSAQKGITAKVDSNKNTVEIVKDGSDFTQEEIVDYFVRIIMNDNIESVEMIDGDNTTAISIGTKNEEDIRTTLTAFFVAITKETNTRAIVDADMVALLEKSIIMKVAVDIDGLDVPSESVRVKFARADKEDPEIPETEKPEDGKEDPKEDTNEKAKDKDKDKEKTPATGIYSSYAYYSAVVVIGAALFVTLKKLRKFN